MLCILELGHAIAVFSAALKCEKDFDAFKGGSSTFNARVEGLGLRIRSCLQVKEQSIGLTECTESIYLSQPIPVHVLGGRRYDSTCKHNEGL